MDVDDEPAMAYFLPDGIADDSPPKQSRIKASFGPIGGRSPVAPSIQSTAASPANTSIALLSSGASSSRSDVDLSGLHARPNPTLEVSPFGSSTGPASPTRPSNYLLSDLGGTIHTPRAFRELENSVSSSKSPIGAGVNDSTAIGRAGAIRSPTSMFGRTMEAATGLSLEGARGTSKLYQSPELSHLYRGGRMATYLASRESTNSFVSTSMPSWPGSDASQPRRILQRPPGLVGPPGLRGLQIMDGMQPQNRLERQEMLHQRVSDPQFESFQRFSASPTSSDSASASNRTYSQNKDQYGASLLSRMRLSMGELGDSLEHDRSDSRGVAYSDLAELNTRSKVQSGMYVQIPVDLAPIMGNDRAETTSSKLGVKPTLSTRRILAKAREDILGIEGVSDLRAKALEFTMEANKTFTSKSPTGARQSTSSTLHASLSSYESKFFSNDQSKGKGRDDSAPSSPLYGNGNGRRGLSDRRENLRSMPVAPPGFDARARPGKITVQEYGMANEVKPLSRSTSKGISTRKNEKTMSRRQMYREKQAKDSGCEQPLPSSSSLSATSLHSPLSPSQETQASSDSQISGVLQKKRDKNALKKAKSKTSLLQPIERVAAMSKLVNEGVAEALYPHSKGSANDNTVARNQGQGAASSASEDDGESCSARADALLNLVNTTEHESSSSSDLPEDRQSASEEMHAMGQDTEAASPVLGDVLSSDVLSSDNIVLKAKRAQAAIDQERAPQIQKSTKTYLTVTESSRSASRNDADPSDPDQSIQAGMVGKKQEMTEHRKEKHKKDKADKKKLSRGKKDKRGSLGNLKISDAANDTATEAQDNLHIPFTLLIGQVLLDKGSVVASAGLIALRDMCRGFWTGGQLSFTGLSTAMLSYVGSMLAACCRKTLVFSLQVISWFIRVHRVAFRAILTHRYIGFCFVFLYGFPFLVQYVLPWAPPWAPVCLWYAFLVQLFCTNGSTAMVTTFRVILPLVFLVEGISHHSFLLDLNGAELLLTSFIIAALKINNLCSPIFFLSLATQCLLAVFFGSQLLVQWLQLALALYSLYAMAATEDEWLGMGEEEDELSCHSMSLHHSIADYNRLQAPPSVASIQKTKRLDRRALAYIRGRKFR